MMTHDVGSQRLERRSSTINGFWAVNDLTWDEVHLSVRCLQDVPHPARPSRLCQWRPLPCPRRVLAERAKTVVSGNNVPKYQFLLSSLNSSYIPIGLLPRGKYHSGRSLRCYVFKLILGFQGSASPVFFPRFIFIFFFFAADYFSCGFWHLRVGLSANHS